MDENIGYLRHLPRWKIWEDGRYMGRYTFMALRYETGQLQWSTANDVPAGGYVTYGGHKYLWMRLK